MNISNNTDGCGMIWIGDNCEYTYAEYLGDKYYTMQYIVIGVEILFGLIVAYETFRVFKQRKNQTKSIQPGRCPQFNDRELVHLGLPVIAILFILGSIDLWGWTNTLPLEFTLLADAFITAIISALVLVMIRGWVRAILLGKVSVGYTRYFYISQVTVYTLTPLCALLQALQRDSAWWVWRAMKLLGLVLPLAFGCVFLVIYGCKVSRYLNSRDKAKAVQEGKKNEVQKKREARKAEADARKKKKEQGLEDDEEEEEEEDDLDLESGETEPSDAEIPPPTEEQKARMQKKRTLSGTFKRLGSIKNLTSHQSQTTKKIIRYFTLITIFGTVSFLWQLLQVISSFSKENVFDPPGLENLPFLALQNCLAFALLFMYRPKKKVKKEHVAL